VRKTPAQVIDSKRGEMLKMEEKGRSEKGGFPSVSIA
jgi:hypothetical protein